MMNMAEHFDEMTCLLYLEGQLEKERADEFAAHSSTCPECRKLMRALESEARWLRESLEGGEESVPARLLEPPRRAPMPWGWLMALGFGATGLYALWGGMVEPWQKQFTQAGFTQGNFMAMIFFSGAFWKGWGEMQNLVEVLALVGLMGIVGYLLRHSWRRWAAVGLVMGALGFSLAMPPVAAAGESHHGDPNYTLPAGQTINTDLYVAAQTVRIDGDVNGDVYSWSQTLTVNGHVTGDVIGFGQEITINGHVDGNVRDWSQVLVVAGTVGKNMSCFNQRIELDPKGTVDGSITAWTGDMNLDGPVGRDIRAGAGSLDLNNTVGGNINVYSHDITVSSSANLKGELVYHGDRAPRIDSGAKVVGPVRAQYEERVPAYKRPRTYFRRILNWAAGVVFGLVLIAIFPGFFGQVVRTADRVWQSCGIGMLILPGAILAGVIACVTIIGLAVGLAWFLLYAIALYSAHVFVGAWLGERILGEGTTTGAMAGRLALGLFILALIRFIPWVGGIVAFIVLVWGLGAISIAAYKQIRPTLAAASAA
jgi:cytoskeletal protein CcmA (bactofilin family)